MCLLKNWIYVMIYMIHGVTMNQTLGKEMTVCKIDLVLLVDHSGSIIDEDLGNKKEDWEEVKRFLEEIVGRYVIGADDTQIALVTFANNARVQFGFGATKEEMISIIRGLDSPFGQTFTAAAINMANSLLSDNGVYECANVHTCQIGHRPDATNVVLLMTDGLPTKGLSLETISDSDKSPETQRKRQQFIDEAVHRANILRGNTDASILALGVTDQVNNADMEGHEFLQRVVDREDLYFKADNFGDLMASINNIKQSSCTTVISACNLDVAFAVDMSGSVDEGTVKSFLIRLVTELYDLDQRIHTALIRFANKAKVFNYLDAYGSALMTQAINSMTSGGYTATAQAIQKAKDEVFRGRQVGDRPGKGNVLVIISDGMPTVKLNGQKVEEYAGAAARYDINQEVTRLVNELKTQRNVIVISVVVEGKKGKNIDLLDDISTETKTIKVTEFSQLMEQLDNLKNEICEEAPEALQRRQLGENKKDRQVQTDEKHLLERLIALLKKTREE